MTFQGRYQKLKREMRKRKLKHTIQNIIHENVTPNQIAMGFVIGLALSIIPTFGVGMLLALIIAWLMDYHLISTYIGTLIVNPLTAPPVYLFNYSIGLSIVNAPSIGNFAFSFETLKEVALELYLGSIIVAIVSCALSYILIYDTIIFYRKKIKKERV